MPAFGQQTRGRAVRPALIDRWKWPGLKWAVEAAKPETPIRESVGVCRGDCQGVSGKVLTRVSWRVLGKWVRGECPLGCSIPNTRMVQVALSRPSILTLCPHPLSGLYPDLLSSSSVQEEGLGRGAWESWKSLYPDPLSWPSVLILCPDSILIFCPDPLSRERG